MSYISHLQLASKTYVKISANNKIAVNGQNIPERVTTKCLSENT